MSIITRIDMVAIEITNAFAYDKGLGQEVARSNLITVYNEAIEAAASAGEKALSEPYRSRVGVVIRKLRIAD